MNSDNGYVLKNSEGIYYCGLNTFKKELYKAQIYRSKEHAEKAIDKLTKEKESLFYKAVKRDFKLVRVTISEDTDQ